MVEAIVVSEGTPPLTWRSISVAQRNPLPDTPPRVCVQTDTVARPLRWNASSAISGVVQAWTAHLFGSARVAGVQGASEDEYEVRQVFPLRIIARPPR